MNDPHSRLEIRIAGPELATRERKDEMQAAKNQQHGCTTGYQETRKLLAFDHDFGFLSFTTSSGTTIRTTQPLSDRTPCVWFGAVYR